jgi:hypothetical protein
VFSEIWTGIAGIFCTWIGVKCRNKNSLTTNL